MILKTIQHVQFFKLNYRHNALAQRLTNKPENKSEC